MPRSSERTVSGQPLGFTPEELGGPPLPGVLGDVQHAAARVRVWPGLGGPMLTAHRLLSEAVKDALALGEAIDDVAAAGLLSTREVRRLARS